MELKFTECGLYKVCLIMLMAQHPGTHDLNRSIVGIIHRHSLVSYLAFALALLTKL